MAAFLNGKKKRHCSEKESELSSDWQEEVATGCFIASVENSAKPIHETRTGKRFKGLKDTALLFLNLENESYKEVWQNKGGTDRWTRVGCIRDLQDTSNLSWLKRFWPRSYQCPTLPLRRKWGSKSLYYLLLAHLNTAAAWHLNLTGRRNLQWTDQGKKCIHLSSKRDRNCLLPWSPACYF